MDGGDARPDYRRRSFRFLAPRPCYFRRHVLTISLRRARHRITCGLIGRLSVATVALVAVSCARSDLVPGQTLRAARAGRAANVVAQRVDHTLPPPPSDPRFTLIRYPAPLGSNGAY